MSAAGITAPITGPDLGCTENAQNERRRLRAPWGSDGGVDCKPAGWRLSQRKCCLGWPEVEQAHADEETRRG